MTSQDRIAWLQNPTANCSPACSKGTTPWRVVLIGAPGVGKGTQAQLLHQRLGACHLSTGDVFRAAASRKDCSSSPAMAAAFDYMHRGELVPDSIVWDMVRERAACLRCGGGFLLDGFPRTLSQAESLHSFLRQDNLSLNAVINYELPIPEIFARLSGRRSCSKCKAVFHVASHPPKQDGLCDHCGSPLIQREDDHPESIKVRLATYEKSTAALIHFYRKLDLLLSISASGSPEHICARTLVALNL